MKLLASLRGVSIALIVSVAFLASPTVSVSRTKARKKEKTEQKDGGASLNRVPTQTTEVIKNKASNVEFFSSNYGIFGLNVSASKAGGIWPRGSGNAYIFGGGIWFGGNVRNPWNLQRTVNASSAGPGAATAAGLVPFALCSETRGSIISTATPLGVAGLRPTFGRVSRFGALIASWTMDKVGCMCRSVEDCALVAQRDLRPGRSRRHRGRRTVRVEPDRVAQGSAARRR